MQRYHYYVREGVCEADLAPFPEETLPAVHRLLSPRLLANPDWKDLIESLHHEILEVHKAGTLSSPKMMHHFGLHAGL